MTPRDALLIAAIAATLATPAILPARQAPAPEPQIIVVREVEPAAPSPAPVRLASVSRGAQWRELEVEATAYCDEGVTYSGLPSGRGGVAVDPRVIPLGSVLYVPGYGYAVAIDTGGAVKGNVVDVFLADEAACWAWGRKQLTIRVYE